MLAQESKSTTYSEGYFITHRNFEVLRKATSSISRVNLLPSSFVTSPDDCLPEQLLAVLHGAVLEDHGLGPGEAQA